MEDNRIPASIAVGHWHGGPAKHFCRCGYVSDNMPDMDRHERESCVETAADRELTRLRAELALRADYAEQVRTQALEIRRLENELRAVTGDK